MATSIQLEDFSEGLVPGIAWPSVQKDAKQQALIQGWIDGGQLICPGQTAPDPILDWLITPAGNKAKEPIAAPVRKAKPKEIRGTAWIATLLEFTDGFVLEPGTKVEDASGRADMAAKSCADRIKKETGMRPLIIHAGGYVRVIEQRFLLDRPL
jgi:hypothetical protein